MKPNYYSSPYPYRNLAAFIAIVGSILLWQYHAQQGSAAFAAVLLLFAGAVLAIVAVLLALKIRDAGTAIQAILLLLWQIGFPLILLTRLYHQAV